MWCPASAGGPHLGSCRRPQLLRAPACRAPARRAAGAPAPRAALVADPQSLEVRGLDGSAAGSESLALRVADPSVANGLVHRYVVFLRQNARRVRPAARAVGPCRAPAAQRAVPTCRAARRGRRAR